MSHVFGPVPSRRLGRSLGVDLLPLKTCSYDCIYCQAGDTTSKTCEPGVFNPVNDVLNDLEHRLLSINPDAVTFSGSGEPTLHSRIHQVIRRVRELTEARIAVLTNGSLLWRKDVRNRILGADLVMPTLSTVYEATFQLIHRPHPELSLPAIINGLADFREEFGGELAVEVLLLKGINDGDEEIEGLKRALERIMPDRIQLNTVVRPPSSREAVPLDRERLEEIRGFLGGTAEVIAGASTARGSTEKSDPGDVICEMAGRRPIRVVDAASSLDIPLGDAERIIRKLVQQGILRSKEHGGEIYFSAF